MNILSKCYWIGHKTENVTPDWVQEYKIERCSRGKLHVKYTGDGVEGVGSEHPDYKNAKQKLTKSHFELVELSDQEHEIIRELKKKHERLWFHI